jgi:hypothetical protein
MQTIKATIYIGGLFGVRKTEVRALEITTGPYAQYPNSVSVMFVEKGKRATQGYRLTNDPHLVILEGHGHLEPDGMMGAASTRENGVIATQSRYASCDPRWRSDFDAQLTAYLAKTGAKVLHDYRGHDTRAAIAQQGA